MIIVQTWGLIEYHWMRSRLGRRILTPGICKSYRMNSLEAQNGERRASLKESKDKDFVWGNRQCSQPTQVIWD